jgi:Outer membrane protein beta-barrel domain
MQKLFLLLLHTISITCFAQRKYTEMDHENFFRIGAKAGVNANKISGKAYKEGFNYNYQLGAFIQINFSNRFGIQPEVNFVQTSTDFTNDPSDVYNDIFRDGSQKYAKLSYLELPVLLNINIGPSKRVKLQFGPSYNGLLKETVDSLKINGSIYSKADWAGIAGLWLQLPFIHLGARYKIGFTNLNAIDNRQTWKSQCIQVFAGFTL